MVGQDKPNYDPYRIVGQRPGRGTGDLIITTADGRRWVPATGKPLGTGEERASDNGTGRLNPKS